MNDQRLIASTGKTVMEGYLYVMGCRDDVINVGGLKLVPTEVGVWPRS